MDSSSRIRVVQRQNILDFVFIDIDDRISNVNVGSANGRSYYGTITFNIILHPITEEGKFKRYLYGKGNYK